VNAYVSTAVFLVSILIIKNKSAVYSLTEVNYETGLGLLITNL